MKTETKPFIENVVASHGRFQADQFGWGRNPLRTAAAAFVAVNLMSFVGFAATATAAVSITNRDEVDHRITLVEGESKKDHVLKPNQALEGVCAAGCVLRLNESEDDEYQLEGNDVVSIEDGYLYYDTPDAAADAQAKGAAPGAKAAPAPTPTPPAEKKQ